VNYEAIGILKEIVLYVLRLLSTGTFKTLLLHILVRFRDAEMTRYRCQLESNKHNIVFCIFRAFSDMLKAIFVMRVMVTTMPMILGHRYDT